MCFKNSNVWWIFVWILPCSLFADMFVLRAGYGFLPGVLRYNEENGAFIDRFDRSTNGVYTGETQEGMCFGPDGNLYTTGNTLGFGQVNCFDGVSGQLLRVFAPASMMAPTGLRFSNGGALYVCGYTGGNFTGPAVFVLNRTTGAIITTYPLPSRPYDLAVSKTDLLLASTGSRILSVPGGGTFATVDSPRSLTFGPDGNLFVASYFSNCVFKLDGASGTVLSTFVASGSGGLARPTGLAFGPDGHLYVACSASNAVFRYNGTSGAYLDQFVAPRSGGLDSSAAMIAFAPIPQLRAQRTGTNALIAWPAALTNYRLESSSTVPSSNGWAAVTNAIGVIGRERVMTNSFSSNAFYRLQKQ